MAEPVSTEDCHDCEAKLHTRINERPTWKIVLWVLFIFFCLISGSYGYTSVSVNKVEEKQWTAAEKMVTKEDFKELKADVKADLAEIKRTVESLRP